MNEIEVSEFEEFEVWAEGIADSTKMQYKSALNNFCKYHNKNPNELIKEALNFKPEGEDAHLQQNPAEKRLQEWFSSVRTLRCMECGEVFEYKRKIPGEHLKEHGMDKGGYIKKYSKFALKKKSKNSAATYWRQVCSFYTEFGVNISIDSPKASVSNERPDYHSSDVKKMVNGCKRPRDRAIILTAFQGGMNPQEVVNLDYGDVKYAVENDEYPHPIYKTRQKTEIKHHVWLLKDAVEAIKLYIAEREKKEGEIAEGDPLFIRINNGKRIRKDNIRDMMRDLYKRIGDQIPEANKIDSPSINPLSLKYLRRAFSIACREANVPEHVREYWIGHIEPYSGAYNSRQLSKSVQKRELEKVKPLLSITSPQEDIQEDLEEQRKKITELEDKNEELSSRIEDMEELMKRDYFSDISHNVSLILTNSDYTLKELDEKVCSILGDHIKGILKEGDTTTLDHEPLKELSGWELTRLKGVLRAYSDKIDIDLSDEYARSHGGYRVESKQN